LPESGVPVLIWFNRETYGREQFFVAERRSHQFVDAEDEAVFSTPTAWKYLRRPRLPREKK